MYVGQAIGPFDVDRELGSGAMGTVFRGRHRKTGKRVAIKFMMPGAVANKTAMDRFEREVEVLKQLNHPNIVQFYGASRHQGAPYYAMEYIEGESLDHVLQRRGRLTWEEVVELGKQICAALQHAHDQGIIHRDLKPSNLMIMPNGTLKLTDFGIAKDLDVTQLTAQNCTVGTAAYMSPEQCKGERGLTFKSDLYSLGVVLYELVTGQKPFQAETTMDMFLLHVQGQFERPSRRVLDIPIWLDTLICQLLEKEPEHRPLDANTVAEALDRVAEKVAAQQSAGVDAARARRGDARSWPAKPDAADKAVARTLLRGKRKRRSIAWHERTWIRALGLLIVLAGIVTMVVVAFQPPKPEKLYQAAERAMQSKNPEDQLAARKGPIEEYLRRYGQLDRPETAQIRQWADAIDLRQAWTALLNRRKLFSAEGPAEEQARSALQKEEEGDLSGARERWETVASYKTDPDPDLRPMGLVGEQRVQFIDRALAAEAHLVQRITDAASRGLIFQPKSASERTASVALRCEAHGDLLLALSRWQDLQKKADRSDSAEAPWYLLACKKAHELEEKKPAEEEALAKRLEHLNQLLTAAEAEANKRPLLARTICNEVVELYESDKHAEVAKCVARARQVLASLPEEPSKSPS